MDASDLKIIQMRKDNCRLSTIREYLSGYPNWSMIDEAVQLAHVLSVLDDADLAVSRKEVRTAFNRIYQKEHHLDKKGYLNWYYKAFHIKQGTKVATYQVRAKNPLETPLYASQITAETIEKNINQQITPTKHVDAILSKQNGKGRNKNVASEEQNPQEAKESSLRIDRDMLGGNATGRSPKKELGHSDQQINEGADNGKDN